MTVRLMRPLEEVRQHCGLERFPDVPPPSRQVDRYAGMIRVRRRRRWTVTHDVTWPGGAEAAEFVQRIVDEHAETLEAWLHEETPKGWRLASHWRPRVVAGKPKIPAPWAVGPADRLPRDDYWPALLEAAS